MSIRKSPIQPLKINFNYQKLCWNIRKTFNGYKPGGPGFDQKITGLIQNSMKLIFYPGWHGLTRIDPVNSVLVKNDGFDPKRPKTHFLPWSTWFDPYWPGGLGFDGKMRLTREKYFWILNSFLIFLDFYK
jgi:hypothetical protein